MTTLRADFESAMGSYIQGDYATAHKEFSILANEGNTDAQIVLGDMYANGQGVEQDYVQAYKWYDIAGRNGSRGAALSRDSLGKKMDKDDLAEAQKQASEWQPGQTGMEKTAATTNQAETSPGPSSTQQDRADDSEEESSGFFSNLSRSVTGLVSGSPTSSLSSESSTGTIGVRGLDAENLRAAQPDLNELQKMESYYVSEADASGFAINAVLKPQKLAYLEDDTHAAKDESTEHN